MLNRSKFALLSILFAVPLLLGSVAYGETGPSSTNITSRSGDSTTEAQEAPETEVQKTEREARIKKLKDQQKTKLAAAEKKKIQEKCQAAQGKVSSVGGQVKGIETSRAQANQNLVNRLLSLVEKLKAKGVDTTQFETDITELTTKIGTFNTDLATYKQSVADLKNLDCKTDPDAFKVALLAARTNLETVKADSKAIHTYLNDTIKPLLKTIRAQVEGESTQKPSETESQGGAQ